jgi:vacuolar iron transporter family protein
MVESHGVQAGAGLPETEHPDHHHADVAGGWLRAATFGAMDGLVSNIALIAGVGGGGVAPRTVVLTGMAGLVAGAISMALGEYTSVQTQNEQYGAEIEKERAELERHPHAERQELADMLRERGLSAELADEVAHEVSQDPDLALRVHTQQELGIVPDAMPSPWTAAFSSFACFAVGALVPLIPYLLGGTELWPALAVGGLGLFVAGALVSRFTARAWWKSGFRQFALGGLAAGATYLVGRLIGVGVS